MKRRQILSILAAGMIFLLALGLMLYPIISSRINTKYASQIQTTYEAVIEDTDNGELLAAREEAIRYNEWCFWQSTRIDASEYREARTIAVHASLPLFILTYII